MAAVKNGILIVSEYMLVVERGPGYKGRNVVALIDVVKDVVASKAGVTRPSEGSELANI